MFRSIIRESTDVLQSVSRSVKKMDKFQKEMDKSVKGVLKQSVGNIKKTLPTVRSKTDACTKKVGDNELCNIIVSKYQRFYNDVCQATPSLCDDFASASVRDDGIKAFPAGESRKTFPLRI